MSAPALLPRTAPFGDDERTQLDRVLAPATATQRAWLAGFLAGLDASAGAGAAPPAPALAAAARPAAPLTVLYASESGNAEKLAAGAAKEARKLGFKPTLRDLADLDPATLPGAGSLIVIASTWGEGEPPARAAVPYAALLGEDAPPLGGLPFAVLALGDTAYPEFCAVGRTLDARFEALGGRRVAPREDLDLDYAAPAKAWIARALAALKPADPPADEGRVITVQFGRAAPPDEAEEDEPGIVEGEVVEHVVLNSSRSDKETVHLALGFADAPPPYEPGDALELFAPNDPAEVEAVLAAAGLGGAEDALRAELTDARDVTTLSARTLDAFVAATGDPRARALIEGGGARDWLAGRRLIDLLDAFPATLSPEVLRSLTRPLAPRAYSIASSRREVGEEAHLLVAAVRYEAHGRARGGVASTHVADRLRVGEAARVRLKRNPRFRLPRDGRDIVMVGPGTGVAPFRGFVQERRALGAAGRAWLFFGERRYTHDFLYQLDWQEALEEGALTRLDVAFSRDAPRKVYVQDRLWERRRDLVDWIEGGANFYVCGDAKAMARDVRATLVRAFAEVKSLGAEAAEARVRELERGGRYLADTY